MSEQIDKSTLVVPNSLFFLSGIHAYAAAITGALGFDRDGVNKILLALEEAVTNVVKHAFEPDEKATYQIMFEPLPSGIRIIIKDKGIPFTSYQVPEYVSPTDLDEVPSVGLGSLLMKKSMDELTVSNLGREGKEVHLVKYFHFKSVVESPGESGLEPFPKPWEGKQQPARKRPYSVRIMEPSESLDVSRLFYRAYGYSYVNDVIYYPDKFAGMHEEGLIISVVTASEENRVVGHVALVKDSPKSRIADTGMAAVQPDYRGQGCQEAMITYLAKVAKDMGLMAIYSEAVTNHPYAQKAGQKAGFRRCALILGFGPAEVSFKGIHEKLAQRESVLCGFLPLVNPPGISVYAPEHHKVFIAKIYESLGLQRIFAEPGPADDPEFCEETSRVSTKMVPVLNSARIDFLGYGKNADQELKVILMELCVKKVDQITLFLNLEDPLTAFFCSRFEELGFFISGILPFSDVGDALVLQYLNNVSIDYSRIQAASDMGEYIREYVRRHDPMKVLQA